MLVEAVAAALAGAAIGAAIAWRIGRKARELAAEVSATQEHIAKLEDEYARWEFVRHLAPHAFLIGEPPEQQHVILEAEETFKIASVDYLTGSAKPVVSQDVRLEGKRIAIPIEDQFVRAVLRIESNPWDGSGVIQFRFRTRLGDLEKDIVFMASVVPEIKLGPAGRVTEFRRLVDRQTVLGHAVARHASTLVN